MGKCGGCGGTGKKHKTGKCMWVTRVSCRGIYSLALGVEVSTLTTPPRPQTIGKKRGRVEKLCTRNVAQNCWVLKNVAMRNCAVCICQNVFNSWFRLVWFRVFRACTHANTRGPPDVWVMKMFVCRFPIRWLSVVNRAFGFGLSGLEANQKKKKQPMATQPSPWIVYLHSAPSTKHLLVFAAAIY